MCRFIDILNENIQYTGIFDHQHIDALAHQQIKN